VKEIPLTQGKVALVDDEDFEWLRKYQWVAKADGRTHYAHCTIRQDGDVKMLLMHRLVMKALARLYVHHINTNGLDNRHSNLKVCTSSQNAMNRRKRTKCSSKYKGVHWNKSHKKWYAMIRLRGRVEWLGSFNCEVEAAKAYNQAAKRLFGDFARLNPL